MNRYTPGPAGVSLTPAQVRMLEPLLRRTAPASTTRSEDARLHRELQRMLSRWIRVYGRKTC